MPLGPEKGCLCNWLVSLAGGRQDSKASFSPLLLFLFLVILFFALNFVVVVVSLLKRN